MARRKKKNKLDNKQIYYRTSLVEIWDAINKNERFRKPTIMTIDLDVKDFENISHLEHV